MFITFTLKVAMCNERPSYRVVPKYSVLPPTVRHMYRTSTFRHASFMSPFSSCFARRFGGYYRHCKLANLGGYYRHCKFDLPRGCCRRHARWLSARETEARLNSSPCGAPCCHCRRPDRPRWRCPPQFPHHNRSRRPRTRSSTPRPCADGGIR